MQSSLSKVATVGAKPASLIQRREFRTLAETPSASRRRKGKGIWSMPPLTWRSVTAATAPGGASTPHHDPAYSECRKSETHETTRPPASGFVAVACRIRA